MADEKSIEQRVSEIIVNQLNVNEEQITPEASFLDDLGADSLDTVELNGFRRRVQRRNKRRNP